MNQKKLFFIKTSVLLLLFCITSSNIMLSMHKPATLKELTVQKVAQSASEIYQAQGWEALETYLSPLPQDIQEEVISTLIEKHAFADVLAQKLLALYTASGTKKALDFFKNLPYSPEKRAMNQKKILAALILQLPEKEEHPQFNQILSLMQSIFEILDFETRVLFVAELQNLLTIHRALGPSDIDIYNNPAIQKFIKTVNQEITQFFKTTKPASFSPEIEQLGQTILQDYIESPRTFNDAKKAFDQLVALPTETAQQVLEYLTLDFGLQSLANSGNVGSFLEAAIRFEELPLKQMLSLFPSIQNVYEQFVAAYPLAERMYRSTGYSTKRYSIIREGLVSTFSRAASLLAIQLVRENKEPQAQQMLENLTDKDIFVSTLTNIITTNVEEDINDPTHDVLKKRLRLILPFLLHLDPGLTTYLLGYIISSIETNKVSADPHEFVTQQVAMPENPAAYKAILDELQKLEKAR